MSDWHELIVNADHWRIDVRPGHDDEMRFSVWSRDATGEYAGRWLRLTGELSPLRVREDVVELVSKLLELDVAELAGTDPESRRYAQALVDRGVTL